MADAIRRELRGVVPEFQCCGGDVAFSPRKNKHKPLRVVCSLYTEQSALVALVIICWRRRTGPRDYVCDGAEKGTMVHQSSGLIWKSSAMTLGGLYVV